MANLSTSKPFRNKRLTINLSEGEHASLKEKAKNTGQPLSVYGRAILCNTSLKVRYSKEEKELFKRLMQLITKLQAAGDRASLHTAGELTSFAKSLR
jgi:hypothetical protein